MEKSNLFIWKKVRETNKDRIIKSLREEIAHSQELIRQLKEQIEFTEISAAGLMPKGIFTGRTNTNLDEK